MKEQSTLNELNENITKIRETAKELLKLSLSYADSSSKKFLWTLSSETKQATDLMSLLHKELPTIAAANESTIMTESIKKVITHYNPLANNKDPSMSLSDYLRDIYPKISELKNLLEAYNKLISSFEIVQSYIEFCQKNPQLKDNVLGDIKNRGNSLQRSDSQFFESETTLLEISEETSETKVSITACLATDFGDRIKDR